MIIALASPRVASSLDDGLDRIKRFLSNASAQGAEIASFPEAYFASVNYAMRFQESATCVIDPSGRCQAYLAYGEECLLVQAIKLEEATGLIAARYAPDRYEELGPE